MGGTRCDRNLGNPGLGINGLHFFVLECTKTDTEFCVGFYTVQYIQYCTVVLYCTVPAARQPNSRRSWRTCGEWGLSRMPRTRRRPCACWAWSAETWRRRQSSCWVEHESHDQQVLPLNLQYLWNIKVAPKVETCTSTPTRVPKP